MAHQYAQCPCGPNTSLNTRDDTVCGQSKPPARQNSCGQPASDCCKISPITPVKCPGAPSARPTCPGRQSPATMCCSPKPTVGPTPCRQYKNPSSPGHCRKPSKCARSADAENVVCENRNFCTTKNECGKMELTAYGKDFASQTGRTVSHR